MATDKKKFYTFWWPDVSTEEGARNATRSAAAAAAMVSVVTAGGALLSIFGSPTWGYVTPWSFVDAGLFAVIAVGLWRRSRFAAVAGLALYLVERAHMWATVGPMNPVMALLFVLFFVGGVRGTFGYRRLRPQEAARDDRDGPAEG